MNGDFERYQCPIFDDERKGFVKVERLVGLIKILRRGEKRLLRHLYSAITNGEDPLRLELFNLIESGKVKTDEMALIALGKNQSASAFSHLKTRLREDILNVLLMQESTKRIAQANRAATFECRKKLTQAYVLIFRGAFIEGIEVLKSAQIIAERYELVAEIALMNQLVREAVHLVKDVKQLHKINNDINLNLQKWSDIVHAEELALVMTVPSLFKEAYGKESGINLKLIEELELLYRKSDSARIGLWYYLAYIEYSTSNSMYAEAIDAGKKFVILVENNPSIHSKNDVAGSNQMLGTAYLNIRDYANSVIHFTTSDKNFPVAGNNRLMNLELLYRAYLGSGNFEKALETVSLALNHPRIKAKQATLPRWFFLQSCVQFVCGDIDGAYRNLNRDTYLTKQRDDWNVQFRLLEIMIMIEKKDEEWIDFRIQTLRKFFARNRRLLTPRVKASLDILSAILRKGLEFESLGKNTESLLRQSLDESEGFKWNAEGAEVIRLDHWVQSKRKKQRKV